MNRISIPEIGSYVVLTEGIPLGIRGSLSGYVKNTYHSEGWWETSLPLVKGDWFEVASIVLPKKTWNVGDHGAIIWVKILRSKKERKFLQNRFKAGMALLRDDVIKNRTSLGKSIDLRWKEWIPYSHRFEPQDMDKLVWVKTQEEAIRLQARLLTEPKIKATEFDRFVLE